MRVWALAIVVLLLGVSTRGDAQQMRAPLVGEAFVAPALGPLHDRSGLPSSLASSLTAPLAPPECWKGPVQEVVVGAALGALFGAVIVFVASVQRTVSTMGHDRLNGTPIVVGGAVLGGVAGIASWRRRCT
ncbi:MAG TPA: hypothetical protein PK788_01720 [Gemmatimonadaceae bacterium]|nr:hypothetical protein [Gemmatimonadaceae bacterium]HRQ77731.1 hypothetical protein [Gemmatimonadaceae bacterium]